MSLNQFGQRGQALVEFSFSSLIVALTLTFAGFLIKAEWYRGKCAYIVFEKTHAALTGAPDVNPGVTISISQDDDGTTGEAQCGAAQESVQLPTLEARSW